VYSLDRLVDQARETTHHVRVLRLPALDEGLLDIGADQRSRTGCRLPVESDIPVLQALTDRLDQRIHAVTAQFFGIRLSQQIRG
jgi:hypothetical protein